MLVLLMLVLLMLVLLTPLLLIYEHNAGHLSCRQGAFLLETCQHFRQGDGRRVGNLHEIDPLLPQRRIVYGPKLGGESRQRLGTAMATKTTKTTKTRYRDDDKD